MAEHYNKLVRDKAVGYFEGQGRKVTFHIAPDDEYREALLRKIVEEAEEVRQNPCREEFADLEEAITATLRYLGISRAQVESTQAQKRAQRGGFYDRIMLESVE